MSKSNPHDLKVGQQVWFIPGRFDSNKAMRPVKITKIGRDWGYISYAEYRFDLKTLKVDGNNYSGPEPIVIDIEAHRAEVERKRLWWALRNLTAASVPDHITAPDIQEILNKVKVPSAVL